MSLGCWRPFVSNGLHSCTLSGQHLENQACRSGTEGQRGHEEGRDPHGSHLELPIWEQGGSGRSSSPQAAWWFGSGVRTRVARQMWNQWPERLPNPEWAARGLHPRRSPRNWQEQSGVSQVVGHQGSRSLTVTVYETTASSCPPLCLDSSRCLGRLRLWGSTGRGFLKQQTFLPHSFGSWKSEDKVPQVPFLVRALFLACRWHLLAVRCGQSSPRLVGTLTLYLVASSNPDCLRWSHLPDVTLG